MSSNEQRIRPAGRIFCPGERIRFVDNNCVTSESGEFVALADPDDALVVPCPAAPSSERRTDAAFVVFDGVGVAQRVPYERLFSE